MNKKNNPIKPNEYHEILMGDEGNQPKIKISELEPQVKILEPEIEILEPQVKILESEIEVLEPQVKILESQFEVLEPQVKILEPQVEVLEPTVALLQASLAAEKERVLRLSAEFENYKKRSSREMADFRKFANETILKQLLTVVDNLERAISSAVPAPTYTDSNISDSQKQKQCGGKQKCGGKEKINCDKQEQNVHKLAYNAQQSSIVQGIEMTYKDIIKLLEAFNVKTIQAQGKPFDPIFHQAVQNQESDKHPDNTVIMELQKGYILHDRLLRPSMVVVSKVGSKKSGVAQDAATSNKE